MTVDLVNTLLSIIKKIFSLFDEGGFFYGIIREKAESKTEDLFNSNEADLE